MPTKEQQSTIDLERFLHQIRQTKTVWLLKNADDGCAMCQSNMYEDTTVLLFWSDELAVAEHIQAEWSDYTPASITAKEFLATWLKELHKEGNVLVGPNWATTLDGPEIEPEDVASGLVIDLN